MSPYVKDKNMTEKKCTKYEELFVKEDETELLEHIKSCPYCRMEHENMKKVSALVKEVSFTFRRQKALQKKMTALAASFFIAFLAFFVIEFQDPSSFVNGTIASLSGNGITYEQMGLPVDEYGFIMVDFEE